MKNISGKCLMIGASFIKAGGEIPTSTPPNIVAKLLEKGLIGDTAPPPKPVREPKKPRQSKKAAEIKSRDLLDPEHVVPRDTDYSGPEASGESALDRAKRAAQ